MKNIKTIDVPDGLSQFWTYYLVTQRLYFEYDVTSFLLGKNLELSKSHNTKAYSTLCI